MFVGDVMFCVRGGHDMNGRPEGCAVTPSFLGDSHPFWAFPNCEQGRQFSIIALNNKGLTGSFGNDDFGHMSAWIGMAGTTNSFFLWTMVLYTSKS